MPTYPLTAINVGSFPLGEADKVITMFSKERGLTKGVAKGAKKPGTKLSGKSELLCVNNLLLAKGKSLDIITQAESLETFPKLRIDLEKLTFAMYFAELTKAFGDGLEEDSEQYFSLLLEYLERLSATERSPSALSIEFEFMLLQVLGLKPELKVCVRCRSPLTEYSIGTFVIDMGGICCDSCTISQKRGSSNIVKESSSPENEVSLDDHDFEYPTRGIFVTPLVWKYLVLASARADQTLAGVPRASEQKNKKLTVSQKSSLKAARSVVQKYLEDKVGYRMKSLDLLASL